MDEEQKLRRDLERYRYLLCLTTDQRAVAALYELIKQTLDRISRIKHRPNEPGETLCRHAP